MYYFLNYILRYVFNVYLCIMKKRRRFFQEHIVLDDENREHYLVIIELNDDNTPINSFTVRVPKPNLKFPRNPYLLN